MALKTLGIVSLVIKAVLMLLIVIIIAIGAYGTFGSEAYKVWDLQEKDDNYAKRQLYLGCEQGFVGLAIISVLLCAASIIPSFIGSEENKGVFMGVDIGLCTFAAVLLVIAGGLIVFGAFGECNLEKGEGGDQRIGDLAGGYGYFGDCDASMTLQECVVKYCRKMFSSNIKTAAGALAIVIGLLGFCAPCGLAVKVNKKEPQAAVNAMGGVGGQEQSGGGVPTGTPQYQNQMYGAPPPQYQVQYGGAYGYATPQPVAPQMSPSQNPAMAYPQGAYPPQGFPQNAPQGEHQST